MRTLLSPARRSITHWLSLYFIIMALILMVLGSVGVYRLYLIGTPSPELENFKLTVIEVMMLLGSALVVSAMVAYMLIQRSVARPLTQLARTISTLQADATSLEQHDLLETPSPLLELETVRQSIQHYRLRLNEAHNELESKNAAFREQARRDALTGIHNRRAFEEDWAAMIKDRRSLAPQVALLLFDCDHFKPINDTYGHHVGDWVLKGVAECVSKALRSGDRLYRLGGDEFATLLLDADEEQARSVANRCIDTLRQHDFRRHGVNEPVNISIGIAVGKVRETGDLTRLQARADVAMYQAKRPGNQKIAVHHKEGILEDDTLVASLETSALYEALVNPGRMEIHFQRIAALHGGQDYHEALCRIRHGNTLLTPDRFMPVVQARRLEAEFDLTVIQRIQDIIQSGSIPRSQGVSINLFAQSLPRPEIISHLLEITHHIDEHPLMLEITETSLVPQLDEVAYFLQILRSNGYQIALDDFGSGFSPLRYLADLPVEVVKFDMSLVRKLQSHDRAGTVVADFARLMIDAGYTLIAEGIESEPVYSRVKELGFLYGQGFHLGKPAGLENFDPANLEQATAKGIGG
jgi:diguanylate cyclase (GGDEF)-like protein